MASITTRSTIVRAFLEFVVDELGDGNGVCKMGDPITPHTGSGSTLPKQLGAEGQTADGVNYCVNRATKLSRTFTAQVLTLNRYRGSATEQKVSEEHVHVIEGGQAIVGAVSGDKR